MLSAKETDYLRIDTDRTGAENRPADAWASSGRFDLGMPNPTGFPWPLKPFRLRKKA